MGLSFDGQEPTRLSWGDRPVTRVMLGDQKVWPTEPVYGVFSGGTVTDEDGYRFHRFEDDGTLEGLQAGIADGRVVGGGAGGGVGGGGGGRGWEGRGGGVWADAQRGGEACGGVG